MTFPRAGAQIYRNEAGEPTGWDYPADDAESFYCDMCGLYHDGGCDDESYGFDEDDE